MTRFVFSKQNANATRNLYATDGTAAGTTDLDMSRFNFSGGSNFTEFNGRTVFLGNGGFGGPYTYVYTTDGTAAGTTGTLVAGNGGALTPRGLWVVNGRLLAAGGTTGTPPGLFASSDGVNFTEIETGVGTDTLRVSHGIGYFAGDITDNSSNGLWRTDGTAAGTYNITPQGVTLNPADITSVTSYRTIFVNQAANGTGALWVTNGTAAGTYQIHIAALGTSIDVPQNGVTTNGKAIFSATDGAGNISVWATNGLAAGTTELLVNGPASGPVRHFGGFTQWGNKVLFSTGYGVAVTDGTKAGTIRFSHGEPDYFTDVGSRVFIATSVPSGTPTLYTSDGTARGTVALQIDGLRKATGDYTLVNDQVVFAGIDTSGKQALFSSDGTAAGSRELSLPMGLTIDPNNLPLIGALPEPASSASAAPLKAVAASLRGSVAGDMTAKAAGAASSRAAILPETTHSGSVLGVLNPHAAAMIVPDQIKLLHHIA